MDYHPKQLHCELTYSELANVIWASATFCLYNTDLEAEVLQTAMYSIIGTMLRRHDAYEAEWTQ